MIIISSRRVVQTFVFLVHKSIFQDEESGTSDVVKSLIETSMISNILCELTLSYPRGGHYGPPYHESDCRCCMVRATLTKLPDFVPFHICQVPESQFWCLFFKKLKKIDVENFWGSSSIRRKSENFEIFCFFTNKPYFFKLNLNCTCSQLSFEVHNTLETQNFENFEFFYYNID